MKAVVLVSGGLDSATALYRAMEDGYLDIVALSFNYGSIHNAQENLAAGQLIAKVRNRGISIERIMMQAPSDLFKGSGSALMGESAVPEASYSEVRKHEGAQPTVVPNRNMYFISVATTIALTHGAEAVYAGMHADDAHGGAYPDCTPEFVGPMTAAVWRASDHKVKLVVPFLYMTKPEIVALGTKLGVPYELTYSCYEGRDRQCGKCATCQERLNAFHVNGFEDPADYE